VVLGLGGGVGLAVRVGGVGRGVGFVGAWVGAFDGNGVGRRVMFRKFTTRTLLLQ
jgi:hypothetical protein